MAGKKKKVRSLSRIVGFPYDFSSNIFAKEQKKLQN